MTCYYDRIGLLALGLLVGGCGSTGPEALSVRLELSGSVVARGDSITVEVVGRNDGTEPLEVVAGRCPQSFDVLTPAGADVGPESLLCALVALEPVRLGPGEELRTEYVWKGLSSDGTRLPAGGYHLRGWLIPIAGDRVFSELLPVQLPD